MIFMTYDFFSCICLFVALSDTPLIYVPSTASKSVVTPSFRNFFVGPASLLFCGNRLDKLQVVTRRCCRVNVLCPASCVLCPSTTHTLTLTHSTECVWLWPLLIATPQQKCFLAFSFHVW